MKDNDIINNETYEDLKNIIKNHIENEKIQDLNQKQVDLPKNINFKNLINLKIFEHIGELELELETQEADENLIKTWKILLIIFELNKQLKFNDYRTYNNDIEFLITFFVSNFDSLSTQDKENLNKLSNLYFNSEFFNIIPNSVPNIKKIYDKLKKILKLNIAYCIDNNLYIQSKSTKFEEDDQYSILKIHLDRNSKCDLKNEHIFYFVNIILLDNISIQYCFIEEIKDKHSDFKKKVISQIKMKSNIDTLEQQNTTTLGDDTFKSNNMNELKNKVIDKNKLYENYIFGIIPNDENDKNNLLKYKQLISSQ